MGIQLKRAMPDAPYFARFRDASNHDLYRVYLDERPGYVNSTAFFLDAADAFFDKGLTALGVREADIEESFVRSGGHGGQNVNKTSTCVMLVHRPTGVQVKCQETRQQGLNRFIARRLLLDKIETAKNGFVAARRVKIA